jgi:oxygen-independent coproporphyrinogen-3 oxidase
MHDTPLELLSRYDRPGPRYTSYPTVPQWTANFDATEARRALSRHRAERAAHQALPLSLYVHIPFCRERCLFCGCNVVIDRHDFLAPTYPNEIRHELELVIQSLGRDAELLDLHFGGGTPTHLSPQELTKLVQICEAPFAARAERERSIEVDPMVTSDDHLRTLRELGFSRISMGVQDLDATVQALIGRNQSAQSTRDFQLRCQAHGFVSIHMDLIYGLPGQTRESFARTIQTMLEWQPDRVSLFNYAHVPWMQPHQRRLDASQLPKPLDKWNMLLDARAAFGAAGYRAIGLDHFARPGDALARAVDEGRIRRNFMGYTAQGETAVLALGMSAISEIGGAFYQNHSRLPRYRTALLENELPIARGMWVDDEDRRRGQVIHDLLCRGRVRWSDFDFEPQRHFAVELSRLAPLRNDGLVRIQADGLELTDLGQVLARNVAMVFDRHLDANPSVRYSRTI